MTKESSQPLFQEVFLQYFSKDRHRIYNYIYSMLLNTADAEDAFQQASIVLWKSFPDFDQSREFYPWACGVALHAVKNYRRAARRRRDFPIEDELMLLLAKEHIASSQRRNHRLDMLEECLALLKPADCDLVMRVYDVGSSAQSVAEEMGYAVQTVYNRLNLVRKRLLECVSRKTANA